MSDRSRGEHLESELLAARGARRAELLIELAWELSGTDPPAADELAREAGEVADGLTDGIALRARADVVLAATARRRCELDSARALATAALGRLAGDRWAVDAARAYLVLAGVHLLRRDPDQAERCIESAVARLPPDDERADRLRPWLGNEYGRIEVARGRFVAAIEHFVAAVPACRAVGDRRLLGLLLTNLGSMLCQYGDYEGSLESYEKSLAIQRELEDRVGISTSMYNLALLHHRFGDWDKSESAAVSCLELANSVDESQVGTSALSLLAAIGIRRGEHERALAQVRLVMERAAASEDRVAIATAQAIAAAALVALGRMDEAEASAASARAAIDDLGDGPAVVGCRITLAEFHDGRQHWDDVVELLEPVVPFLETPEGRFRRGDVAALLARARARLGRSAAAVELLTVALDEEASLRREGAAARVATMQVLHELDRARHREERLAAARDELVERVQQRTSELEETNRALGAARRQRDRAEQESRDLEEKLRQAHRLEAVGRLAGGIAHDFNNLLMVIVNGAHSALKAGGPDGPSADHLQQVLGAADRASLLTSQLLAFGQGRPAHTTVVDLHRVIAKVEGLLHRVIGADIEVCVDLAESVPMVAGDPTQLEQVLLNLAVNARDAMPDGGRLTISTASVVVDRPRGLLQPGRHACLRVEDTGCGIAPDIVHDIFDPFFTTKDSGKGTGLGLSTTYGVVRRLGGEVRVESEPGHGAAFELWLPEAGGSSEVSAPDRPSAIRATAGGDRRVVLVVEDDDQVRGLVQRGLSDAGFRVLAARDGVEALEIADRGEPFHVVVADVVLPSLGGPTLVERLRVRQPALPVLFTSGHPDRVGDLMDGEAADTSFLLKPFRMDELVERVNELAGHDA